MRTVASAEFKPFEGFIPEHVLHPGGAVDLSSLAQSCPRAHICQRQIDPTVIKTMTVQIRKGVFP